MEIAISDEIKALWPNTALGILRYEVDVADSSEALLKAFENRLSELSKKYTTENIAKNTHIAETRQAYKALGKSPQKYRNAAEAMLRRVVSSGSLYHINNVVEINNYISVSSGYSIGSYDLGELRGEIVLHRAKAGEHYGGIGKGSVNIEYLPVLCDVIGPFGNPSSDSRRAMIQVGRRDVCSVIYSFDGGEGLRLWMDEFAAMLKEYCKVDHIEMWIVL